MWIAHAMLKPLVFSFAGTAQYFQSVGLPGALVTPVFAAELAIGAALVFGIYARQAALLSLPILLTVVWVHMPEWLGAHGPGRRLGVPGVPVRQLVGAVAGRRRRVGAAPQRSLGAGRTLNRGAP